MERFFRRLGLVIANRRRLIIIIGLLLVVASLFGAIRLTIDTGASTWVSPNSKEYKDFERLNKHFSNDVIVVMVTGDSLSQLILPENLKAMATVENQMASNPKVLSAVGPTYLMTMMYAQQTGMRALPDNPQIIQAMVMDPQTGQIRPQFSDVLPNDTLALIPIVLQGGTSRSEQKELIDETQRVVDAAGFVNVAPVITGEVVVHNQLQALISNSLRNMLIVAIILMLVILALLFSVRGFFAWRWLPLGIVGIGIIYTFGIMGYLSVPISMVTMAVFPILIGLGIDYSINLQNRYDEEIKKGEPPAKAVINSVTHIGPALAIALFSECIGFSAIFFSHVPMVRAFGLMLIVGVIACYIAAIFFTLLFLYWRDSRVGRRAPAVKTEKKPTKQEKEAGWVELRLRRFAPWVVRNPGIIVPIALALAVVGFIYNFRVETETNWTNLFSADVSIVKNYRTLLTEGGGAKTYSMLLEADDVTDPGILNWMVQFENFVRSQHQVTDASATSVADLLLQATGGQMPQTSEQTRQYLDQVPAPLKVNLISSDYKSASVAIGFASQDMSRQKQMRMELDNYAKDHPIGSYLALTGNGVISLELFDALVSGRTQITLIGIGIVFLALFLMFRFSLTKTILSWLPLVLVIGWTNGVMYLAGIKYNQLTVCLGALIMGMGVEYTILYMMRYYEERGKGEVPATAMVTAVTKVGRAVTASGVTTIGGFAALLAAVGFLVVSDFGLVTMLAVFFGLVSALVVHPPLVVWVDSWLEKRRLAVAKKTLVGGVRTEEELP
jgi:hydrophobe/amphiphile efflux-3 (HAE3) family protein